MIIIIFLFLHISCSKNTFSTFSTTVKYFESPRNHLFSGNKLWLFKDGTFKLIKHGPAILLSVGRWTYNASRKEIELASSQNIVGHKVSIDTLWVDLTRQKLKVLNGEKILFDEIVYYIRNGLN